MKISETKEVIGKRPLNFRDSIFIETNVNSIMRLSTTEDVDNYIKEYGDVEIKYDVNKNLFQVPKFM
jgi:hypothetical protein